jgi:hypothetical protein
MKTVIEMAREAGMAVIDDQYSLLPFLERFAEIVRADEREACAKACDELHPGLSTKRVAEIIRARSNT